MGWIRTELGLEYGLSLAGQTSDGRGPDLDQLWAGPRQILGRISSGRSWTWGVVGSSLYMQM